MTTLDVFDALDALITLLTAAAVPAGLLEGVGVGYGWDPQLGTRCLYGGSVSFESDDAVAELEVLSRDTATVTLIAEATNRPPGPVKDADAAVKAIRVGVEAVMKANPKIGGVWSWQGIVAGRRDYFQTDDETMSRLFLQLRLGTYAGW
jgi:hypothetical protein